MSQTNGPVRCPSCNQLGCEVKDSRVNTNGTVTRRRRACTHCLFRFTTYEVYFDPLVMVRERQTAREKAADLRRMADALESW